MSADFTNRRLKRPRIVYVSPNRSHHYRYAEGLERAGLLHRFVSGFPRFSSVANALEVPQHKVVRCDMWQLFFVASGKLGCPSRIQEWLNMRSKLALDRVFAREMESADIGLFYNGAGLSAIRRHRGSGKMFVCEAVNGHVSFQRRILEEEAASLEIEWRMPDAKAIPRRVAEYRESDLILGPSSFVQQTFAAEGVPPERFLKNAYGFSVPKFDFANIGDRQTEFTVLYVGQLNFRKGLRYLVEVFKDLPVPSKRLRLVGPTSPPTGLEGIELPCEVEFSGVLKGDALAKAYAAADVFVQPSLEEGLSLVIGEAMGAGLPVVATTATGAEEVMESGESGFIVRPRDIQGMGTILQRLVADLELRKRIGGKARQVAESFGGWKASGDRLANLLEDAWSSHHLKK